MSVIAVDALTPAALALVGALASALVAFFGVRVSSRSERRLRLEAAMDAARLLAPTDGSEPTHQANATALLSLADLDQIELAIVLLYEAWPLDGLSNESAVLLVDKALRSRSRSAQRLAAELLWRQAAKLDARTSTDWPRCVDARWPADGRPGDDRRTPELGVLTRLFLFDGMLKMTLTQVVDKDTLSALAVRVSSVYQAERDIHLREAASELLGLLMPDLCALRLSALLHADVTVSMDALRSMARAPTESNKPVSEPIQLAMRDRFDQVRLWLRTCEPIPASVIEADKPRRPDTPAFRPVTPGSSTRFATEADEPSA